jgi:hypothetical protein
MKTAIVCHDAGGAEVISNYIKDIDNYYLVLEGPAKNIFKKKFKKKNFYKLEKIINKCDRILCGTSIKSNLEVNAIKYGKKFNIKTIAFLEHWVNYRERFSRNGQIFLPNEIYVGDSYAKNIAKKIFRNISIKLIKNPYWLNFQSDLKKIKIKKFKQKYENILYLTENLQQINNNNIKFSDFDAIKFFFKKINYISNKINKIIFRVHPSENSKKYKKFLLKYSDKFNIEMSKKKNLIDDIVNCDIAVGCQTMAMVMALFANKKVFSSIPIRNYKKILPHKKIIYLNNL